MSTAPLFNTTDSPVVIDEQGHQLDGKSWGEFDPDGDVVQPLIESGVLIVGDPPKAAPPSPDAKPKPARQPASEE